MNNVTVSTFAAGFVRPSGSCKDEKSDVFYNIDQRGPFRKFHKDGTIETIYDAGRGGEDCVVDYLQNIYIGIILITV
jgi:hypothetical protein